MSMLLNSSFDNLDKASSRRSRDLPPVQPQVPYVAPTPDITNFSDLDAQAELLTQYNTARRLLAVAEYNENVPLSQKAQALNTISSILSVVIKMKTELYNAERLKTLEATLLEVLQEFPEMSERFMPLYEARLGILAAK